MYDIFSLARAQYESLAFSGFMVISGGSVLNEGMPFLSKWCEALSAVGALCKM
mgnify:CR=1 FL=1